MRFVLTVLAGAVSLTLLSHVARANNSDTACGAILCLAGEAMGQGGSNGCTSYLNAYFSIVVFKGGVFKSGDTKSERGNFLSECTNVSSTEQSSLNSQFGPMEFLP